MKAWSVFYKDADGLEKRALIIAEDIDVALAEGKKLGVVTDISGMTYHVIVAS